jgi:L-alanine-DL-glutamate epimerase-like enolase superfamily enzyme
MTTPRRLSIHREQWTARVPFRITGYTFNEFDCVVCEVASGGITGRGEALGVYYGDENSQVLLAQLEEVRAAIEGGVDRAGVQALLPPGGARFAIDAALWDLEAKLGTQSVWALAGVAPKPVETVFTVGLEPEPAAMAAKAAASPNGLLKIKLNGDRPVERVAAVRQARPDARLVVDANQGFSFEQLKEVATPLAQLGVQFIEQPLPRGGDAALEGYRAPLPLCGDESCLHLGELPQAARRYQMINIKLDKCGGLTEGLALARAARERGLGLMVGCMGGTSLSMAPAHVLAQRCDYVDIDGPLLLKNDRLGGLDYAAGWVTPPQHGWGLPLAR